MNLVELSDPGFGSLLRINGMFPLRMFGCMNEFTLTIGPLCKRSIRVETIHNRGARFRDNSFTEKSCTHFHVSGIIQGTDSNAGKILDNGLGPYEPGSSYSAWALPYSGVISCHYEYNDSPAFGFLTEVDFRVESFWVENEKSAKLAISCEADLRIKDPWGGDSLYQQEWSLVFTLPRSVDPYTGNVTYGEATLIQQVDPEGEWWFIQATVDSQPVNSDDLGTNLQLLRDYTNDLAIGMGDVRYDRTSRDAAIYDAIEDIQLGNFNPLQNVLGSLIRPMQAISQLARLAKKWTDPRTYPKKLSTLHLFWKYVVKTGWSDIKSIREIMKFLKGKRGWKIEELKNLRLIGRGEKTLHLEIGPDHVTDKYSVKVCFQADIESFQDLMQLLHTLRLTPRFIDLWDIVPYSFVVDWILPLGDAMNNLEMMADVQRLPFVYMIISRKTVKEVERTFSLGTHVWSVSLRVVSYERKVTLSFPSDVWLGISFRDPRKQALTATALIIQKAASN